MRSGAAQPRVGPTLETLPLSDPGKVISTNFCVDYPRGAVVGETQDKPHQSLIRRDDLTKKDAPEAGGKSGSACLSRLERKGAAECTKLWMFVWQMKGCAQN